MKKDNVKANHKSSSAPLTPLGECWVSDIETHIQMKGNRFRLLRILIDPRVTTIRLQQHSAAIFMNTAPRDIQGAERKPRTADSDDDRKRKDRSP